MALVRYAAARLAGALGLLLLSTVLVAGLVEALPGDAAVALLRDEATPERLAAVRAQLGLDRPFPQRYAYWATGLLRGDLGTSLIGGADVRTMLGERLANSAALAGVTVALLVPLSLALGVAAGLRAGRRTDRVVSVGVVMLAGLPEYALAALLVAGVAVGLGWLPAVSLIPAGESPLAHPTMLVLPVLTLLLVGTSYAVRVIRGATAAALRAPHVESAHLNGMSAGRRLRTAVLPAVLPAAVQVWTIAAAGLFGGAILVEQVYNYPGVGVVLTGAVANRDLPVLQACAVAFAAATLTMLVVADVAARALVPRLRTDAP